MGWGVWSALSRALIKLKAFESTENLPDASPPSGEPEHQASPWGAATLRPRPGHCWIQSPLAPRIEERAQRTKKRSSQTPPLTWVARTLDNICERQVRMKWQEKTEGHYTAVNHLARAKAGASHPSHTVGPDFPGVSGDALLWSSSKNRWECYAAWWFQTLPG